MNLTCKKGSLRRRTKTARKSLALLLSLFMLFSLAMSLPAYAQDTRVIQGSNQKENTFSRTRITDSGVDKLIKAQGLEDIGDINDEGDWPEKGSKYIITKDLSQQTAEQLVQQIMGEGIQILNVRYTGTSVSAGSFTASDANIIGFTQGIILSSGNIKYVDGPNIKADITCINDLPGDERLDLLIPGYKTNDATVLEFDFIPTKNTLSFDYVFSSDEYNEFVDTRYNDVFGFYLNGKNIALIPNTNTPIAINNVNKGPFGENENGKNSQYYRNNENGQINTEMDGLTTVLTATATVQAGQKNTIRLAIADTEDHYYDSNVFIKGSSFTSVESDVLQFSQGIQEVNEDAGTTAITVTRSGNMQNSISIEYYTEDGSAKAANEYLATSGTLVFEPGVSSKTIPVTIIDNHVADDIKYFYMYLKNPTGAIIGDNIRSRILINEDDIAAGQSQTILWEEKTQVPTKKNYIINFTAEIDPQTVTANNFYITKEAGELIEEIKPELTFNKLSVIMKADGVYEYQPGQTYTLFISPNVKSLTGKPLGKQIKMHFTIADLQ